MNNLYITGIRILVEQLQSMSAV